MSFISQLGLQAGSALMGGIVGSINDKRQLKQQEKLMGMQLEKNAEMSRIQHDLQYDMWKKTSYVGQREQMEAAGLNPALMYGMGGGGGSTTGAGSANVSAPQAQRGTEIMDMLAMKTQQAQIELMEAQAKKAEADANKTKGADTNLAEAQTKNLLQGVENQKAQEELTKVQTRLTRIDTWIKEDTYDETIGNIVQTYQNAIHVGELLRMDRDLTQQTWNEKKEIIKQEALEGILNNNILRKMEGKTEAEIAKIKTETKKAAQEIANSIQELKLKGQSISIEAIKGIMDDKYRNVWGVIGGVVKGLGENTGSLFGEKGNSHMLDELLKKIGQ